MPVYCLARSESPDSAGLPTPWALTSNPVSNLTDLPRDNPVYPTVNELKRVSYQQLSVERASIGWMIKIKRQIDRVRASRYFCRQCHGNGVAQE